MRDLALWAALVGFVLPYAIAVVNRPRWSKRVKALVAFAICTAAAVVTSAAAGELSWNDLAVSVITVVTVARVSYAALWHPTGVTTAIENKTSPAEERQ